MFAVGVCYFWPTMLGVTSERFPRGGSFLLALMGAVGNAFGRDCPAVMGHVQDISKDHPELALRYMAILPAILDRRLQRDLSCPTKPKAATARNFSARRFLTRSQWQPLTERVARLPENHTHAAGGCFHDDLHLQPANYPLHQRRPSVFLPGSRKRFRQVQAVYGRFLRVTAQIMPVEPDGTARQPCGEARRIGCGPASPGGVAINVVRKKAGTPGPALPETASRRARQRPGESRRRAFSSRVSPERRKCRLAGSPRLDAAAARRVLHRHGQHVRPVLLPGAVQRDIRPGVDADIGGNLFAIQKYLTVVINGIKMEDTVRAGDSRQDAAEPGRADAAPKTSVAVVASCQSAPSVFRSGAAILAASLTP